MTQKSIEEIQKQLSEPFTKEVNGKIYPAHKWLPQETNDNNTKIACYPYVDRELVIDRLNEVIGIDGWQFLSIREADGSRTGTMSLFLNGKWIDRSDVGTENNSRNKEKASKEKAANSDALKRCASQFGIGLYLNHLGIKWLPCKQKSNGKYQATDDQGNFLYGDNLHNYINGMSSAQGLMYHIFMLKPELKEDNEAISLWHKLG